MDDWQSQPSATSGPSELPPPSGLATSNPNLPPPSPYVAVYPPAPITNVWAVVSLISSILSWLGLFGIGGAVGVITGVIARNEIIQSRGAQSGDGLALAGIILGVLNIITSCIAAACAVAIFVLPVLAIPFFAGLSLLPAD